MKMYFLLRKSLESDLGNNNYLSKFKDAEMRQSIQKWTK